MAHSQETHQKTPLRISIAETLGLPKKRAGTNPGDSQEGGARPEHQTPNGPASTHGVLVWVAAEGLH